MRATSLHFRILGLATIAMAGVVARAEASYGGHGNGQAAPPATTQSVSELQLPGPAAKPSSPTITPAPMPEVAPAASPGGELITERYPNGKAKIERQVTKDAAGNYVNQGAYKAYDLDNKVQKAGEFVNGKQQGKWTQTFAKDEGHLFSTDRDTGFLGPFVSEASFVEGKLQGLWTIKDCSGRTIVSWNFVNGVRSGKWTWWYPNGEKRLEANFNNDKLDGEVLEYRQDGQQAAKDTYIDGLQLVKKVSWYTLGQKHFEGQVLQSSDLPEPSYNWWNGSVAIAPAKPVEKTLQHGTWIEWYQSGHKKAEAQHDHGLSVGRFTWWYENGQKQAEVDYRGGLLAGTWVTWHPNGQKESQAMFKDGELVDRWMHWDAEGKLVETRDFTQPNASQAQQPNQTTSRQSGVIRSR
jgi:antitoxin component YwqK of YwqJK toxin-antitoxin module